MMRASRLGSVFANHLQPQLTKLNGSNASMSATLWAVYRSTSIVCFQISRFPEIKPWLRSMKPFARCQYG
jgi:hypothetical protein